MKKMFSIFILSFFVLALAGCSAVPTKPDYNASIWKSSDGGKSWEAKVKLEDKGNIGLANALSLAIDSSDRQILYLGTEKDGIFITKNGSEEWRKINLELGKVYGLSVDKKDSRHIYAGGILGKRGKIFRSEDQGENWKEIYSEPADSTTISSLEISPLDSRVVYAGTSEGMIFKTTDSGASWKNLSKADGPVLDITFDAGGDSTIYFMIFEQGIMRTRDQGKTFEDLALNIQKSDLEDQLYSIAADPQKSGIVYAGTSHGLIQSADFGDSWREINILETSKKFPIRAIAVNPKNSKEIIYSNAQAIYKSVDGGVNWSTSQFLANKIVEVIKYDPGNANMIYLGMRKID